tara:strand:- start:863 stop:1975 length:1113 start_codon:yes stop_codon:yes gene_type:complete
MSYERHDCRLCGGNVETKLRLNPTPVANAFPDADETSEFYDLELKQCVECQHVQIGHIIPDDLIYSSRYKYSTPSVQIAALKKQAESLKKQYPAARKVLEIGSNNGINLSCLKGVFDSVIGCDPVGNGLDTLPYAFDSVTASMIGEVDLIVANNVFAHIDNLVSVFRAMSNILNRNGAIVFEVQYFLDMAEKGLFDMIYHEHRDYHTVIPLVKFLQRFGLGIRKVEHLLNHGGSIRVHCGFGISAPMVEKSVDWEQFAESIDEYIAQCRREILNSKAQVIAFGASAKACTLIHQLGMADKIAYCVDNTPAKQGKYIAGTNIEIYPESILTQSKSSKTLLLTAWNYKDVIMAKYPDFDFIVPFQQKQKLAA